MAGRIARHPSKTCEDALKELEKAGAKVVEVQIPLARFAPAIGVVTIGLEARASLREDWRDHADEMSHDLQVSLTALQALGGVDFVDGYAPSSGGLRREGDGDVR